LLWTFWAERKREEQFPYTCSHIHDIDIIGEHIVLEEMFDDNGTKPIITKKSISATKDEYSLDAEFR
jgi:hypothetical protein